MKKVLWTVILQMALVITYGQDVKTPTKQETMDWIAGKLKQYMRLPKNRTFISYSNGIFIYEKRTYICDGRLELTSTNTINLNKVADYTICSKKPNQETSEGWYCEGSKIIGQNLVYTTATNNITGNFSTGYGNSIRIAGEEDVPCYPQDRDNSIDYTLFNFDLEAGLLTRMQKAFKQLIKYNTIKSDEPFQ